MVMAEALSAPKAPSATASITYTAPTQRQSCDRCHKQKLRCTREKNGDGGVCDRCLGKHVRCVYSLSLPKGRPSAFRRADEPDSRSTKNTNGSEMMKEMVQRTALRKSRACQISPAGTTTFRLTSNSCPAAADDENDIKSATNTIMDAKRVGPMATNVFPNSVDTPAGASVGMWPQVDTLNWDEQLGADWDGHESGLSDEVLPSIDTSGNVISTQEEFHPSPPDQLHYPQRLQPTTLTHGELERANFERYDCTTRSNPGASRRSGTGDMTASSLDGQSSWPNFVIAQLSQLSAFLSSIRHSSSILAKAALSFSCCVPIGTGAPLIDAATLKSVGAWLTYGHGSNNSGAQTSVLDKTENENDCADSTKKTGSRAGHGILNDVFSASHRLLDILRKLQAKNMNETSSSSSMDSGSRPLTASSDQYSLFTGLTEDSWSSKPSYISHPNSTHTMQIIRHLVMACEALLLEIYMEIFTALQHDVSHHTSGNGTSLGDVRVVMTVQLCSYLIERQHQAVESCLVPQDPINPVSFSGIPTPKFSISAPQQPLPPGGVAGTADIEVFGDIKTQLQGRLARLRQTLRCT